MKRCTIVLIICVVLNIFGAVTVFADSPTKTKLGACDLLDYGNNVYYIKTVKTLDSRDEFGKALSELIQVRDREGSEFSTMTKIDEHGYWIIFRKKSSR